jgi:hypothetical protein
MVLKDGLMIQGLPSLARLAWPFCTWVHVLSYVHVLQLFVSTFVSSFRHERTSTVGKIYMKMQMQDLCEDF